MPFCKSILLTGAGFSKNFDGFLGSELWEKILNTSSVHLNEKLRKKLLSNFNFEDMYSDVLDSDTFTTEEKEIMKNAVEKAYEDQETNLVDWIENKENIAQDFDVEGIDGFLKGFIEKSSGKGLLFTLNQDLFMEQQFRYRSPGAEFDKDFYRTRTILNSDQYIKLPPEKKISEIRSKFDGSAGLHYIKLHGSFGWTSDKWGTGMVLGINKWEKIQREPLLKWYFELFENSIKEGNRKLLVIGYGFGDMHINKILCDGVRNSGLKLYIITQRSPKEFIEELTTTGGTIKMENEVGAMIWSGVRYYLPNTLDKIFQERLTKPSYYNDIVNALESP